MIYTTKWLTDKTRVEELVDFFIAHKAVLIENKQSVLRYPLFDNNLTVLEYC